ncbi:DsrE family protein [Acidobacteriota bacterium]
MSEPDKLLVVWTSGDKEVAKNMVFMYTYNAKLRGWWKTVRLLVWGASSKLLAEDKELQDYLKKMEKVGVELFACKACADIYSVGDTLGNLGVDVKYMGVPLTEVLKKSDWRTITF